MADEKKAEAQANELRAAMKGMGTNENKLIEILAAKRSNDELKLIIKKYGEIKDDKGKPRDLIKDLKDETSMNFEKALVALATDKHVLDARLVNAAIKGIGTNESKLNEVVCTRSPADLKEIAKAYEAEFKKSMLEDIKGDTSGDAQKLYITLLTTERKTVSDGEVAGFAKVLYDSGENKLGTNEAKFIEILAGYTHESVAKINKAYEAAYHHDLRWVVKDETSGDLMKALKVLATPQPEYFARQLQKAMVGMGTNDEMLIRILVTQKWIPGRMAAIAAAWSAPPKPKQEGKKKKKKEGGEKKEEKKPKVVKPLREYIASETSGDYKKLLLAVFDQAA